MLSVKMLVLETIAPWHAYLSDAVGKAKLLIKEDGVISGVEFAKRVFNYVDPRIKNGNFD